jgi:hypothetical protein
LRDSASEFLIEALRNHADGKDKFAIVHAVTATELYLKARLAKIHPQLVYAQIDKPTHDKSVELRNVAQRLRNFGVAVSDEDRNLIDTFAEWRNEIAHHMPSFDIGTAKIQLPTLLDYLARFLREELQTPLQTFLPRDLFPLALSILKEWERVVSSARGEAKDHANVVPDRCPRCHATEVVCILGNSRGHCFLCGAIVRLLTECSICGNEISPAQLVSNTYDDSDVCSSCLDRARESYIESLIDAERGK